MHTTRGPGQFTTRGVGQLSTQDIGQLKCPHENQLLALDLENQLTFPDSSCSTKSPKNLLSLVVGNITDNSTTDKFVLKT